MPLAFGVAALCSAAATPLAERLSLRIGAVDRPDERKVSRRLNVPVLGGLAVSLGFFMGLAVPLLLLADASSEPRLEALLLGGLLVLGVGALDDRFGLAPIPKLVAQIGAAAVAIGFGFQIDHVTDPISRTVWHFPAWVAFGVTTGWIVIVTNSINLIDGLDGLCSGVSAIIAITLTWIAWQGGHLPGMVIGTALVGALLGFLPFNFPPARIFLGDTGTLFVGYVLAILALEGYQRVTVITFIVPLFALAVPLLDTGLSILRRIRSGKAIMQPDRQHIHHRLLSEYQGSQRSAVLSIYFLTACFCVIAVSFTRLQGYAAIVFLAVIVLLTLRILRNLGLGQVEENAGEGEVTPGAGSAGVRAKGGSR